jgi:hypothetical protein
MKTTALLICAILLATRLAGTQSGGPNKKKGCSDDAQALGKCLQDIKNSFHKKAMQDVVIRRYDSTLTAQGY